LPPPIDVIVSKVVLLPLVAACDPPSGFPHVPVPPEPIVIEYAVPGVRFFADSALAPPPELSPVTEERYPPAPPPPEELYPAAPPPPAITIYSTLTVGG
jgi:hypothetical protein